MAESILQRLKVWPHKAFNPSQGQPLTTNPRDPHIEDFRIEPEQAAARRRGLPPAGEERAGSGFVWTLQRRIAKPVRRLGAKAKREVRRAKAKVKRARKAAPKKRKSLARKARATRKRTTRRRAQRKRVTRKGATRKRAPVRRWRVSKRR